MHRILIIDDEDDIRTIAAMALETFADWTVTTARSGAEGLLAAAAEPRPEAILMDVMMPGMDGPTTFREMQRTPGIAGIPVILLTAKANRSQFDHLGVAAVLNKPFDPLTLAQQIAAALHWREPALP